MIHKIEIENFQSIRGPQVLDLRAAANAPKNTNRLAKCWHGSDDRVPKVVALFGPNGSGKSNVLRALTFTTWFISHSFSLSPTHRIPFEPFNDEEALESPTRLKVWTSGVDPLVDNNQTGTIQCQYCYELIVCNGERREVLNEAFFFWPSATGRRTRLVERFSDGSIKAAKAFELAGYHRALETVLRPNASIISTLAQLNHPFAKKIADRTSLVSSNIFIEKTETSDDLALRQYVDHPNLVSQFNREIQRIDVGLRALDVRSTPNGPQVLFLHEGLAVPMPFFLESHGTQQFLKLYPMLLSALSLGSIAIIDELDAAIHPMILPEIIRWFHDSKRNPNNAQLWMSCHNASLLEDLSKDEIVFCDKDHRGRTEIYSLNDIKAVRRDDNYYKKYIGGIFGAVPQVG